MLPAANACSRKQQASLITGAAHAQSAVGAKEVSPVRSRGATLFEEKPR
jgi:hypothetical protein